ncbi:MAG TPA: hypothetical protein VFV02_06645 [Acidimicrobiales bacterium]|nr:hypothetical protein [Acidimicrobiales bacterium]
MRIRPLVVSVLSVSVGALTMLGTVPAQAGASGQMPHSKGGRGGTTTPSPLVYHQGKLLTASTTYAIWWGPTAGFPGDARTGIEQLLGGFGGSNYLGIAGQYMPSHSATSRFAQSLADPSAPPSRSPSVTTIVNEVAKVLSANNIAPDANAIYLVYTSNFPRVTFCAWHSAGAIQGTTVQVGYMPNTAGVAGCDPGNLYNANSYSEGTRSVADSTAHEFMEATTDPVPLTGWADKNGQEIGDKCNFVYSATVTLANKSQWQLQEEWSNAAGGCTQGS